LASMAFAPFLNIWADRRHPPVRRPQRANE